MPVDISQFHFIRSELLWLLIPILAILYKLHRDANLRSAWQSVISPHLLKFLFVEGQQSRHRSGFWLTAAIMIISLVAASGPSFRQKSVPVFQTEEAQIILLDLSLSMEATDIKPSRLERAKFKLLDLLAQTKEGTIGLIVYAGDAFVISPLTSDARTIANMVPTLSTNLMPVLGSRPDLAIQKSLELLKNAHYSRGQVIWLTDGVDREFVTPIINQLKQEQYNLAILAIGTEQGAPIPLPDKNGFLKDRSGSIVVPKLQTAELNDIAAATGAGIIELTADDSDIQYLKEQQNWQDKSESSDTDNEQAINRWIDEGYWLIWLVLPLFIFKILRHPVSQGSNALSIGILFFSVISLIPTPVHALEWQDLWLTKNQQANRAFQQGDYQQASQLYDSPSWKGAANYKAGNYAEAANNFDPAASERSLYNHATSLAKGNNLQEALDAYNQLLEKNPQHEDALFNKKIIEDLLKKQQEQQQQQNQQDQKDSDEKNQDQQNQQSQDANSENQKSDEQNTDQQQQNEQQSAEQKEQKEAQLTEDQRDQAEKDQALAHWLEKIPDDPGGLLRRKMYREYQRRGRQQKEEKLW